MQRKILTKWKMTKLLQILLKMQVIEKSKSYWETMQSMPVVKAFANAGFILQIFDYSELILISINLWLTTVNITFWTLASAKPGPPTSAEPDQVVPLDQGKEKASNSKADARGKRLAYK